ncbi:MAG: hypothetical protein ABIH59_01680 [archaeon]
MKSKPNYKVMIFAIIALGFLALTFLVDWLFIIPVILLWYINKKELDKNINKK